MSMMREKLNTYHPEYQEVSAVFCRGAKTKDFVLKIEAIEKVNNLTLKQKFETNKSKYRRQHGHVRIVKVFHGTKKANIPSILRNNLEVRRHGQNRGHRFGAGVSFSAISNYSCHYCDEDEQVKQMLLCLVLVSNITEVPEMKKRRFILSEPPYIEGRWPALRYDTTAKNQATMDVIVKFEDHTFYPAYVIHFRKYSPTNLPVPPMPSPERNSFSMPVRIHGSNPPIQSSSMHRDTYSVYPSHTHYSLHHPEPVNMRPQPAPQENNSGFWVNVISAIGRFIFG